MNRLVYLTGLFTSKNYLFPIFPGAGTQFERELVALPSRYQSNSKADLSSKRNS